MGLRPAPGLRLYFRPSARSTAGIKGSTLDHKASDTVHDLICAILTGIFAHAPASTDKIIGGENQDEHYLSS